MRHQVVIHLQKRTHIMHVCNANNKKGYLKNKLKEHVNFKKSKEDIWNKDEDNLKKDVEALIHHLAETTRSILIGKIINDP